MPIPTFQFEDPAAGLPRQPVPVRLACMATGWSPALFAEIVLGIMNEGRPLIAVHEFEATTKWVGEVDPASYEKYQKEAGATLRDELSRLPPNHFVWSDDLVWAFSDLIDLTIGRESADSGIRWRPALGDCGEVVAESVDLSALTQTASSQCSIRVSAKTCVANYDGSQGQFKDSKGLRYILELLRRPRAAISVEDLARIVNPPPSESLGIKVSQIVGELDPDEPLPKIVIADLDQPHAAIDDKARREYKKRLARLDELIADAAERGNTDHQQKLEEEKDALLKELRRNLDIRGRPRKVTGAHERIRKSVTAAISRAIEDISTGHSGLGNHLKSSIKPGSSCIYRPPTDVVWHVTVVPAVSAI